MTVETLKAAAKTALPILLVALAVPAFAEDVTFSTVGSFSCNTVVASSGGLDTACSISTTNTAGDTLNVTNNQGSVLSVTAIGEGAQTVQAANPNFDDVNVMNFNAQISKNNNFGKISLAGAGFTMLVNETVPTSGTLTFGATMGGLLGVSTSDPTAITFGQTSLTLGNVTYVLDANPWHFASPGLNITKLVSADTAEVLPEPTFMMLTGFGFSGLAFVAYRRRRTA